MGSPPNAGHYGNQCLCGKRQYSKKKAREAAARWHRIEGDRSMVAYKCPHNRRVWHIGHQQWGNGRMSRELRRRDLELIIEREQGGQ